MSISAGFPARPGVLAWVLAVLSMLTGVLARAICVVAKAHWRVVQSISIADCTYHNYGTQVCKQRSAALYCRCSMLLTASHSLGVLVVPVLACRPEAQKQAHVLQILDKRLATYQFRPDLAVAPLSQLLTKRIMQSDDDQGANASTHELEHMKQGRA